MTNPLECDDMNSFSAGHEEKMYLTYDWVAFFLNLPARGNPPWEKPMAQQEYGRDFSYCTAGISITAAAMEQLSGIRFSDYTQAKLFNALAIKNVNWPYNEMGITQGGGGVEIAAKDLLKVGQLVLQQGVWQGEQLIPKDWIEKSLLSYSVAMPEMEATYGITWWHFPYQLGDKKIITHAAAGNGGNYLFVIPELNASVVILATAYNTPYMHKQSQKILSSIILPALKR
jgi:CubicO group peptidase (beta-lactamase class C family)